MDAVHFCVNLFTGLLLLTAVALKTRSAGLPVNHSDWFLFTTNSQPGRLDCVQNGLLELSYLARGQMPKRCVHKQKKSSAFFSYAQTRNRSDTVVDDINNCSCDTMPVHKDGPSGVSEELNAI